MRCHTVASIRLGFTLALRLFTCYFGLLLAAIADFEVGMSESKDTAARGPAAASVGLKTESGVNMQTTNAALGVPRNQGGYLSKLFGLGSGTPAVDRSPAAPRSEALEYHPGSPICISVVYRALNVTSVFYLNLQN